MKAQALTTTGAAPVDCCPRCTLEREWLRLRRSPLLAAGGWGVYDGLLDGPTLQGLRQEALGQAGRHDLVPTDQDNEQVRGGTPARHLISVDGGPVLGGLYGTPALHRFIAQQVGMGVRPLGVQATYSMYSGAGAGLGRVTALACAKAGATVILLDALDAYPDSVFVEDTALCLPEGAVVMRPGAPCGCL